MMQLYDSTIPQFKKVLQNLERWIDKAEAYAAAKKFDPEVLLTARLAPDQFPFVRQVQIACDKAKFTAASLTGKEAPKHPDTEKTFAELRKRLHSVITYLDGFTPKDFERADERVLEPPVLQGKAILGRDYLWELQLPNLYFHVTTAYAILRHNGVDLGKADFIGPVKAVER